MANIRGDLEFCPDNSGSVQSSEVSVRLGEDPARRGLGHGHVIFPFIYVSQDDMQLMMGYKATLAPEEPGETRG